MLAAILTICGAMTITSCSNEDDPVEPGEQAYTGVPLVILDTDLGSSTDDLFALEMLHRYEQEGRCRLLGVVVDRMGEANAAIADVMNTYFGHPDTPIGLVREGIPAPQVWIDYGALPTYTNADGSPMFRRSVSDYSVLPDGYVLYRRLLAAQPDHSVSICSIGFVTALAALLQSGGDDLFTLSPRGRVTLTPQAKTIFTPSATGNCRYQLPGSADWNARMLEKIRRYNKIK